MSPGTGSLEPGALIDPELDVEHLPGADVEPGPELQELLADAERRLGERKLADAPSAPPPGDAEQLVDEALLVELEEPIEDASTAGASPTGAALPEGTRSRSMATLGGGTEHALAPDWAGTEHAGLEGASVVAEAASESAPPAPSAPTGTTAEKPTPVPPSEASLRMTTPPPARTPSSPFPPQERPTAAHVAGPISFRGSQTDTTAPPSSPRSLIPWAQRRSSLLPPFFSQSAAVEHGTERMTHRPPARASSSPPADLTSTVPPGSRSAVSSRPPPTPRDSLLPSLPPALGPGDALAAVARSVRGRFTGALAFEDDAGIRRLVFREGDFVTAASGSDDESLIAFLIQRGDLPRSVASLSRKLPQFGRHAGAALIAYGHLKQDDLWPVLRAHAEWVLTRVIEIDHGAASVELELPGRLRAEPSVFGGATGAEVLVESLRRVFSVDEALARLGGAGARVTQGPAHGLLGECALDPAEERLVEGASGRRVEELLESASEDFAVVLLALCELGVLLVDAPATPKTPKPARAAPAEPLDDQALRSRILTRRALVDEADYFALLGVARDATGYDIRRAYLELRRQFEPSRVLTAGTADLRDDVDLILEVLEEAYEILKDEQRRQRYRRAIEQTP